MGFDYIVGSTVNYNKSGQVDSKVRFERVFAERKIEILKEHFRGEKIDWNNSQAYSDSISDLKMLELVGQPVAVTPDSALQSIAERNNWKIINHFQEELFLDLINLTESDLYPTEKFGPSIVGTLLYKVIDQNYFPGAYMTTN